MDFQIKVRATSNLLCRKYALIIERLWIRLKLILS